MAAVARDRGLAARYVDGYLWYGRPWLDNQADPFDLSRSLALAATTPSEGRPRRVSNRFFTTFSGVAAYRPGTVCR